LDDIYSQEEDEGEEASDGSTSLTKSPRKRNKKLVLSLDPIQNFKAYPGRPGYSGPLSSVFENQVRLSKRF
jgi:hypothetical protein